MSMMKQQYPLIRGFQSPTPDYNLTKSPSNSELVQIITVNNMVTVLNCYFNEALSCKTLGAFKACLAVAKFYI